MTRRIRQAFVLGFVAMVAACAALAATISSPVHPSVSPADAAPMAATGQRASIWTRRRSRLSGAWAPAHSKSTDSRPLPGRRAG